METKSFKKLLSLTEQDIEREILSALSEAEYNYRETVRVADAVLMVVRENPGIKTGKRLEKLVRERAGREDLRVVLAHGMYYLRNSEYTWRDSKQHEVSLLLAYQRGGSGQEALYAHEMPNSFTGPVGARRADLEEMERVRENAGRVASELRGIIDLWLTIGRTEHAAREMLGGMSHLASAFMPKEVVSAYFGNEFEPPAA